MKTNHLYKHAALAGFGFLTDSVAVIKPYLAGKTTGLRCADTNTIGLVNVYMNRSAFLVLGTLSVHDARREAVTVLSFFTITIVDRK